MIIQPAVRRTILATAIFLAIASALFLTGPSGIGVTPAQANEQVSAEPTVDIDLTPSHVVSQGTEITVNLTFRNLTQDLNTSDVDYRFRADVVATDVVADDSCEGGFKYPLGREHSISLVDEEPEVRWGTVSPHCPGGHYTVTAVLYDAHGNELATADATFVIKNGRSPGRLTRSNPCSEEVINHAKEEDGLPAGIGLLEGMCQGGPGWSPAPPGTPPLLSSSRAPHAPTLSGAVSGSSITIAWSHWFTGVRGAWGIKNNEGRPTGFEIAKTWTAQHGQTGSESISVGPMNGDYAFYTDQAVEEGVTYEYTVTGVNAIGEGEPSNTVTVALPSDAASAAEPTTTPPAPQNLTASLTSDSEGIVLGWDAPDESVFGYQVLRRRPELEEKDMQDYVRFVNSTSLVDTGVKAHDQHRYAYTVKAINLNGAGDPSHEVSLSPAGTCATDYANTPVPTERPPTPTNFTANETSDGTALSWDAPDDDSVFGYIVLRRDPEESAKFSRIRVFCGTDTSYIDADAPNYAHFRYRVLALNDVGRSWWSDVVDYVVPPKDLHGDTPETATDISSLYRERAITGGRVASLIYPHTDVDYFSITVTEEQSGLVEIGFLEYTNMQFETVDYTRWILHDEEGNCLLYQCDAENGSYRNITTVRLEPGTYYVRLWGPDDNTHLSSYVASRYYSLSWGRAWTDRPTGGCPDQREDIADPLYGCQTNLRNSFNYPGEDINIEPVWDKGNFGAGVNVVVVDSGVDYNHEDLSHAIDITHSGYLEGNAGIFDPDESHGTSVAGVIAAQHNSVGVRGIAPQAKIYSFNNDTNVFNQYWRHIPLKHEHIKAAVSNNSWYIFSAGPYRVMSRNVKESIITGITEGFYGKGTSYVFSAPNTPTGTIAYNTNFFEYQTFYAVITVCGVPEFGNLRGSVGRSVDGIPSWYKNPRGYGTNMWICAPSKVHTNRCRQRIYLHRWNFLCGGLRLGGHRPDEERQPGPDLARRKADTRRLGPPHRKGPPRMGNRSAPVRVGVGTLYLQPQLTPLASSTPTPL